MPSTSEKQKRFFGAVMGAKKGQKGVTSKAKKVAKEMPEKEIKKYLKTEEEDEQSKITIKAPKLKERMRSSGKIDGRTKTEKIKKGPGSYDRKDNLKENNDIINFIECLLQKNYAAADKYIKQAVESKLQTKIEQELTKPLF